ncbi:MAG: histidine phosphatase family protein [Panacagrimonas sp.]
MNARLPQVYLVRHGETAWSLSGQATGCTDIALTERGERNAQTLRARLRESSFVEVLTSPLQRARRTAELAGFGERARVDADLAEWDYGAYEGRRTADIRAERPGWTLLGDDCPGGETLSSVGLRADRVIGRLRALDGDALVFAHRDILRVLAARWLGLHAVEARRLYLTTASVSVLGYHHDLDEPVIRLWNDAAHPNGTSSGEE